MELFARSLSSDGDWVYPSDRLIYEKYFPRYYRHAPGTTRQVRHPDLQTRHELGINSLGLLNRPVEIRKPEGVFRIALIGDSVTENSGVAERFRYHCVMERLLNSYHPGRFEVINCGVSGYGTAQQYVLYKEVVESLKPDIVILQHCSNDMSEIHQSQIYRLSRGTLVDNRRTWSWLPDPLVSSGINQALFRNRTDPDIEFGNIFDKMADPDRAFTETLEIYSRLLDRFITDVVADGGSLFASIFVGGRAAYNTPIPGELGYNDMILRIHLDKSIPCLDWGKAWPSDTAEQRAVLRNLFFQYDSHWSEIGNHYAAIDTINMIRSALPHPVPLLRYDDSGYVDNDDYKRLPIHSPSSDKAPGRIRKIVSDTIPPGALNFLKTNGLTPTRYCGWTRATGSWSS